MLNRRLIELTQAAAEDAAAKKAAHELWLVATNPLSIDRLRQLCLLGEQLMTTALRKTRAEAAMTRH